MTPRIPVVAEPDPAQRAELAKTPSQADGQPLHVFATLAHRPALLRRVNALGGYFPREGTLPGRERELVILRTALRVECAYEEAHHRRLAAGEGLTTAEIAAVLQPDSDFAWRASDRALIAIVDELLGAHGVSDATWGALGAWEAGQRLELMILVGFYAMLGGVLNAVGVQLETGFADPGLDAVDQPAST